MDFLLSMLMESYKAEYRERALCATLSAERCLDNHDHCSAWRNSIKPYMKEMLRPRLLAPVIPLVKENREETSGFVKTTIKDVFNAALRKINEHWNVADPSRLRRWRRNHGSSGSGDEEDEDMDYGSTCEETEEEDHDISGSISEEPDFVRCCKAQVQEWRNNAVTELAYIHF